MWIKASLIALGMAGRQHLAQTGVPGLGYVGHGGRLTLAEHVGQELGEDAERVVRRIRRPPAEEDGAGRCGQVAGGPHHIPGAGREEGIDLVVVHYVVV